MICPVCNHKETKVIDSRTAADGLAIRRRRECLRCGYRFSTFEQAEILDLTVIKRNGARETYSKEKLEKGIKESLEKRPFTVESFTKLINNIERDIHRLKRAEVTSKEIGEIVMKQLKKFDKVAYIRFASVYRSFEDVTTFQKELQKLTSRRGQHPSPTRSRRKS